MFSKKHLLALSAFAAISTAHIHGFSSGSTGADGALLVDSVSGNVTVTLPPDGILNYTTVDVQSGYVLTFQRNAANTPVYMLSQGDIIISGRISVNGHDNVAGAGGAGGPGGYDGGNSFNGSLPAGHGQGPGGGAPGLSTGDNSQLVGNGNYLGPFERDNSGSGYGNSLLMPLIGGSGSAGCTDTAIGGAGGGGAILIASDTKVTFSDGKVTANGGYADGASRGSGGAIRIVAPIVEDLSLPPNYPSPPNPRLDVKGTGAAGFGPLEGAGRIRIDTLEPRSISGTTFDPPESVSIGANLQVFPPNNTSLKIISVGSNLVPDNPTSPTYYTLPSGGGSVEIEVEAENFDQELQVMLVLTPENGSPIVSSFTINNDLNSGGTNPANHLETIFGFPTNIPTRIDVWTQ